ncbi:MAG: hypothetical protein KBA81_05595 [Rhabdochlamydiaceae bacterium]|nr:hypothetical protein [Rhabdochlamydiaceae bacterium]
MALPIVGALAQQAGFNYFYGKQVDKTEAMLRRMTEDVYQKALSTIETLSNDASLQQMDAVNHILILLQNFRSIFSQEMNTRIDKISKAAQDMLAQLDTFVHNWTKGLIQDTDIQAQLKKYEALAQVYLTINEGKPVITAVFPTCISPLVKTSDISIQCVGFFPNIGDRSLTPIFMLKEQKFKPDGNINNVKFSIPYSLLF